MKWDISKLPLTKQVCLVSKKLILNLECAKERVRQEATWEKGFRNLHNAPLMSLAEYTHTHMHTHTHGKPLEGWAKDDHVAIS